MNRRKRAIFAVGIFEACEILRKALIELVTLGYQQKHLFLIRPTVPMRKDAKPRVPADVGKLVVPLMGQLTTSPHQVEFNLADNTVDRNQDAEILQNMETWMPFQQFDAIADALQDHHKILFVRMHEQRQLAPTCSVLLAHCTKQVNTHEVMLPYQ